MVEIYQLPYLDYCTRTGVVHTCCAWSNKHTCILSVQCIAWLGCAFFASSINTPRANFHRPKQCGQVLKLVVHVVSRVWRIAELDWLYGILVCLHVTGSKRSNRWCSDMCMFWICYHVLAQVKETMEQLSHSLEQLPEPAALLPAFQPAHVSVIHSLRNLISDRCGIVFWYHDDATLSAFHYH